MKKEMKVATLSLMTMFSSLVLIVFTMLGCIRSNTLVKQLVSLADEKSVATSMGRQLADTSDYLTEKIRAYAATGDQKYYDEYWTEVNDTKRREKSIERLEELKITDEEMNYITKMKAASDGLIPLEERAMEKVSAGDLTGALAEVYGPEYRSGKGVVNDNAALFNTGLEGRYTRLVEEELRDMQLQVVFMLGLVAVLMAVVLVNELIIRRKVARPLGILASSFENLARGDLSQEVPLEESTSEVGILTGSLRRTQRLLTGYIGDITRVLSRMSQGDMTQEIAVEYVGDFEQIRASINTISRSMNDTLGRINGAAAQVSTGADQVSGGAQALSQGATEQASTIEELSATVTEISSQVRGNAEGAQRARDVARESMEAVEAGNRQMNELSAAIAQISDASGQIGSIIKTIEDIAFQTNILALNAAVEAARAGAAGKGFAVVADEVRNLANKSGEAASNTTALIEQSMNAVENGARIAVEASASLAAIVENTKRSGELVGGIAEASKRQADAIEQVSVGIDQISAVVQTNSATAEQSAAASEELNDQARVLKSLVDRFHLGNAPVSAAVPPDGMDAEAPAVARTDKY